MKKDYHDSNPFPLVLVSAIIVGFLLIMFSISCQSQRQWNKKGLEKQWIDTVTSYQRDTIHIASHEKDSLIYYSNDTIYIRDRFFTEKLLLDTIHHTIYSKTIINSRDTVFTKEIHTVHYKPVPEKKVTMWQAVMHVWPMIAVLLLLILVLLEFIIIRK